MLGGRPREVFVVSSYGGSISRLPPSVADLAEFRNKLIDPSVYTWAQIGSDQWFMFTDIGTVYRNSNKGTAFEARRDAGNPQWDMEYFHMCRSDQCTFSGGQNSQNPSKGRPVLHITKVAYSDSLEALGIDPVLDVNDTVPPTADGITGAPAAKPFNVKYLKGGLALVTLLAGASSRARADWEGFPLGTWITDSSRTVSKFAIDNFAMVGVSVENGFTEGLSDSLWLGSPWWFLWAIRCVCYMIITHQFGGATVLAPWLAIFPGCFRRSSDDVPAKDTAPKAKRQSGGSRVSALSEPPSDIDDAQRLVPMVHMGLSKGSMLLSHRGCSNGADLEVFLLTDDISASHLPDCYSATGIKLCHTHAGVYSKLSGFSMCHTDGCAEIGTPDPNNQMRRHRHMLSTIAPDPPPPKVKFAADSPVGPTSIEPKGMAQLSDPVILSLIDGG